MQDDLNINQRKAIQALLAHSTIESAAFACGLHKRTIYNYLADKSFRDALREQQDRLTAATAARLSGGAGQALKTLEDAMSDLDASFAVRVRAAIAWLKARRDAVEIDELTERITALEAATRE